MKPTPSLFAKILAWFFLNMVLIVVVLAIFFALQPYMNLHAILGQEGLNRLRTAGQLIAHDLSRMRQVQWPDELARHAAIHQVDFTVVLEGGTTYSSTDEDLPEPVMERVKDLFRSSAPKHHIPPTRMRDELRQLPRNRDIEKKPSIQSENNGAQPHFVMRTPKPNRYWSGILIPQLHPDPLQPPVGAMLLAVSDTITGKGFFFRPAPLDDCHHGDNTDFSIVLDSDGQRYNPTAWPYDSCNGGNCQRQIWRSHLRTET